MTRSFLSGVFCFFSIPAFALTQSWTVQDEGAARLALLLKGKTLKCDASNAAAFARAFGSTAILPISIRAKALAQGETKLSLQTPGDSTFGFGGSDLDPVEFSASWMILSVGDDGCRNMMVEDIALPSFDASQAQCRRDSGRIVGDLSGLLSDIWDAGHISSSGLQCCIE